VILFLALAACAGYASSAEHPAADRPRWADLAALSSPQPGSASHPYSFADLFNLTVGAQYGLVSGTAVDVSGALRGDWPAPSSVTPALHAGSNVPGLALGPAAAAGSAMIGIPSSAALGPGSQGLRLSERSGARFEFKKELLPLGRVPEPAGWLIVASVMLVAWFIARRRSQTAYR
jgi:hypothetical protein